MIFASETGLRPSEWIALERRDVQRADSVVTISRTFARGVLKGYGKTSRSRRRVPLSTRAPDALDAIVPRLDSQLLFPGPRGNLIDLHNFRAREWKPALDAAGLPQRRIYDLRHTAISHWLAAGLGSFEVCAVHGHQRAHGRPHVRPPRQQFGCGTRESAWTSGPRVCRMASG